MVLFFIKEINFIQKKRGLFMKKILIITICLLFSTTIKAQEIKHYDSNKDDLADIWIHTLGKHSQKIEIDSDYDGEVDQTSWMYNPPEGNKKLEMDTNNDGKIDGWQYYENNKVSKYEMDTNFDGDVDVTYFMNGVDNPWRIEAKTQYTENVDMVQSFVEEKFYNAKIDSNFDGKFDKIFYNIKELDTWLELNRPNFQDRLRNYMENF